MLRDGSRVAHISCSPNLIPAPGQFLFAADGSLSTLPDPVYYTGSVPGGFLASPAPESWSPGLDLHLRGPLGRGFTMPAEAKRIALVPFSASPSRLKPLIAAALVQGAGVVLVSDSPVEALPDDVEVQPSSALIEIVAWSDYAAFEVEREELVGLRGRFVRLDTFPAWSDVEVLILAPVPCGGMADCGVCAVRAKSGWKMACKDGPVFRWSDL